MFSDDGMMDGKKCYEILFKQQPQTLTMLHNKSTLIFAGFIAALYFLYRRLNSDEKNEIMQTVSMKTEKLLAQELAST